MVFNAEHLRRILAANSCETCDLLVRRELPSRLGRTRPPQIRSRGSETLLCIRSSAGYTIDTHESRFRKRQGSKAGQHFDLCAAIGNASTESTFGMGQTFVQDECNGRGITAPLWNHATL